MNEIAAKLGEVGLPMPVAEMASHDWDAVIVGGGHNGLTAAAYLARAGRSVLVLERRERLGGACTLERPFADERFVISPCAYMLGLLDQTVIDDLDLRRRGLRWWIADPNLWIPFADGGSLGQFIDDRLAPADKLVFIHGLLRRDMAEVRMFLERIEGLFAGLTPADETDPRFLEAHAAIASDVVARDRFMRFAEDADLPSIRARMIQLAEKLGWLSQGEMHAQLMRMIADLVGRNAVGPSEVDMICALNKGRALDGERGRGASRWVAAEPREQELLLTFDAPQTLHRIILEVEEQDQARQQEVELAVSSDGGQHYRVLRRQEYNFSPPGTTFECEDWAVREEGVTRLRLRIKPDKGDRPAWASITSFTLC